MIDFFLQSNDKFFPLPIFFSFIRFRVFVSWSFCCLDYGGQCIGKTYLVILNNNADSLKYFSLLIKDTRNVTA